MCRGWKQLARASGAGRGSPWSRSRSAGRHHCAAGDAPWDRTGLQEVVDRATYTSGRIALQLPPRFDGDIPLPFAKRRDGAPCDVADCPYAFVLGVPTHSRESAEREARRQLQPRATRYFVELRLANACVMSCEELTQIDEPKLRAADPTANATLRLLREAGADVLLIRGSLSSRAAVVFKQAIGRRVQVVDEAAATVGHDGRWVRELVGKARSQDRWRSLARRPRWFRQRPRAGRVAWELTIALVCFLLAPPIAALAGTTLTVPVWAELLLGVAAAGTAAVMTWRALVPARAEIARTPEQLECFERLAHHRKPELQREIIDAFGEGRAD
jgi:hypothetical protein